MSLTERRAAALNALSHRTATPPERFPGETQPSGDLPEDPWQAEAYLARCDHDEDAARQDGATQ